MNLPSEFSNLNRECQFEWAFFTYIFFYDALKDQVNFESFKYRSSATLNREQYSILEIMTKEGHCIDNLFCSPAITGT